MSSFYKFVKENLLLAMIESAAENKSLFLNLSNFELKTIPPLLLKLKDLTKLYLSNNSITDLPNEISDLQALKILALDYNSLTILPPNIGKLSNLVCLNLSHNSLTLLTAEIGQLSRLEVLWLNHCQLEFLPSEIGNCAYLDTLGARGNFLKQLPPEIGKLKRLRWLTLEGNLLSSLPEEINKLTNLIHLNLSNNQFDRIPTINELKSLQFLFLSHNFITEINDDLIGKLVFIRKIDLIDNPITNVACYTQMKNLKFDTNSVQQMATDPDDSDSEDWEESVSSSDIDLSDSSVEEFPWEEIIEATLPQVAKFTVAGS